MKTNNNFDTIGLIISLILSDNFLASVESLAEACDLPVQQMRKYLSVIFDNKNLLTHLLPTPESDDENEDNNFIETASTFLSAILSGNADKEPIYLIDIDRIKSKITTIEEPSDIDQYSPSPYQKYFWGNEYQKHGEPTHIKLRIKAGTTNIIEKIKSDTVLRIETGKLYKDDEYYYYEDDILGMPDFRLWLRSYGSSITVLEPQTLIDEITENTNKTLSYYSKLKSIMA